jgi:hypothetical protein
MVDEANMNGVVGDVFDEDRLMAFALGLDDDPELLVAAEHDAGLRERLETMRAEVADLVGQVNAAVPPPHGDYADLSHERWAQLASCIAPRAASSERSPKRRRGSTLWFRVAVPVTALAVAVAVGVTLVDTGRDDTGVPAESTAAQTAPTDKAASPARAVPGGASPEAFSAGVRVAALGEQVRRHAFVVLAEARAASGAFQRFAVVRVLKGAGPAIVRLRVDGRPADAGSLLLLMLRPLADLTREVQPGPSASPSSPDGGQGSAEVAGLVAYTFEGQTALAQELPADTDPALIELP